MAVETDLVYRSAAQVAADFLQRLQTRVPSVWTAPDGQMTMLGLTLGDVIEGIYLANQILRDNIFIQTANVTELRRHGDMYGLPVKSGTFATGSVRFSGTGGVLILAGSTIGFDPGTGDILYFDTFLDATIPNPGVPTAPTLADSGVVSNPLAGTYEYVVTFQTIEGETESGTPSAPLTTSATHRIDLTAIPTGGPGTTGRRIYRSRNGSTYGLVTTIADNTTTTFNDTVLEGSLGAAPPTDSTAERVTTTAQAQEPGTDFNAAPGVITELIDVPDGVTDVTNIAGFTGGTDEEDIEAYRTRLLNFIRNPKTGSSDDLASWALEVDGVESAVTFQNDDLGTPTPGHATVRIAGPGGSVPSSDTQTAVLDYLNSKDMANATLHVGVFSQVATNVTVALTLDVGYVLGDVTPQVQQAISDYINAVPVGGTVYAAGIIDVIFGNIPGVLNVTTTFTDSTSTSTQKRIPGTLTIT